MMMMWTDPLNTDALKKYYAWWYWEGGNKQQNSAYLIFVNYFFGIWRLKPFLKNEANRLETTNNYNPATTLVVSCIYNRNNKMNGLVAPKVHILVQAGLPLDDNYGMWLSHHQKLSYNGQKSSRHIRLDILNRFAKGISAKIDRRCHTDKRVFGLTINPN